MQQLLEKILDALCKATKRDIFVMLPTKKEEQVPYLVQEIRIALDDVMESVAVTDPCKTNKENK